MEQRWVSLLRLGTKVFAVGAAILFVFTMLTGRDTGVAVVVLVVAVVTVPVLVAVVRIAAGRGSAAGPQPQDQPPNV